MALSQAQANLIAAEAALARLIGYNGRVRAADDSAFYHPVTVIDTTMLLDEAMRRSPAVQSTAATLSQAQSQLKASKSTWWPQLALGGSWTYNGNNSNDFGLQNQRQANLTSQLGGLQPLRAGAEHRRADQQPARWPRPTPRTPSTRCSR